MSIPEFLWKADIFKKKPTNLSEFPFFTSKIVSRDYCLFQECKLCPFQAFLSFSNSSDREAGRAVGLQGRHVLRLRASGTEEESKLGLRWPVQLYLRSRSLVFILLSWKADGYCLLHPDFQARLLASQPAPCSPDWSLSNQLNASFAPLVMAMKSQHCLLPTRLLNNNTRTHNHVLPTDFSETSCLLPPVFFMGREKVVGKLFPRAPSRLRQHLRAWNNAWKGRWGKNRLG